MKQTQEECFLTKEPLPDDSHPVRGRTLPQAQQLLTKILSKYDAPNYTNLNLRHWLDQGLYRPSTPHIAPQRNYSSDEDEACLRKCSDALLDIVFDGHLTTDSVLWAMIRENDPEWERYQHRGGMITNRLSVSSRTPPNRKVNIYVWEKRQIPDPEKRMRHYIGILMREMLSAFLIVYTCMCDYCRVTYGEMEGITGHGIVWQECAYLIENFCLRILGIELDLGRVRAIAKELHYSNSFAEEKACQELGMDAEVVKSFMWGLQGKTLQEELPFYQGPTKQLDEAGAE
jgi:hypothetical protein